MNTRNKDEVVSYCCTVLQKQCIEPQGGQPETAERKLSLSTFSRTMSSPDYFLHMVLAISEVMPSRAVRALESEGRGLSHLEVVARGAIAVPASQ
jgi:hypothetical protein